MKKIMVALAAVAIAFSAKAVAYDWSASDICSGFYAGGAEENASGTAYLFLDQGTTAYSTVVASVLAGTFVNDGYAASALDSAAFNGAVSSSFGTVDSADYAGSKAYLVFVADKVTAYEGGAQLAVLDPVQMFVTDAITVDAAQTFGNTGILFGSLYDDTPVAGNWTAAVPEPTSGILLLLGMAGLALRRRRA